MFGFKRIKLGKVSRSTVRRATQLLGVWAWFSAMPLALADETVVGGLADATAGARASQVITAAIPKNWPPYYLTDANGNPAGFAIDTMNEVAKLAGFEVRYQAYDSFSAAMKALENKDVDVVPNFGMSKTRMKYAVFSPTIDIFTVSAFVRAGTSAKGTEQQDGLDLLKGRTTAVISGNIGEQLVANRDDIDVVVYDNIHEAINDVIVGNIDALIYPSSVVHHIVNLIGLSDKIEALGRPLIEVERGIAMRDDAPELHNRISVTVPPFVQSPAYLKIHDRWFGVKRDFWTIQNLIIFGGIPLIVLSLLLAVWRYASVMRLNRRILDSQNALAKLNLDLEHRVVTRTRELAHEKELAENYLNIAGTMMMALNEAGTVTMINRRGTEILGYPQENIVGQNWFDTFIDEEARDIVRQAFASIMSGELEPVEHFENEVLSKSHGARLISWHNTYVRNDEGKVVGCLSAGEDVTETRNTEDALRVSETRFNQSQEFANIGTWDWNIQTGDLYWSPRIAPLFGYPKGELETTYDNFMGAIHVDDRQAVADAVSACVATGAEYNIEHRVVWPDGTVRWLLEKGDVVRDDDGNALNMLGVVQDITDSKAMQVQLVQSSKLATLGEMATGVAHELNQPLNVIRMAVNNIQTRSKTGTPEITYLTAKLDKVVAQVERASAIIDHMRIFGRTVTHDAVLLDPAEMVSGSLSLIGEQLRLSGVDVVKDFQTSNGSIRGHQVQVEQVLLNLLVNARDVLTDKDVADKRIIVRIASDEDEDTLRIEVEDNGGGIAQEHLNRIFEPFYTTKDVGKGTGLGLSISYGIITEMGGTLDVRNTAQGACFVISLPHAASE